jgi:hypothetical protein
MEETETPLHHRELDHGEEVDGEFLEAGGEPAVFFEPAVQVHPNSRSGRTGKFPQPGLAV